MVDSGFQITLRVEARPINNVNSLMSKVIFQRNDSEAFLVGERFEVVYTLENIGDAVFDPDIKGLKIDISWPNGQSEVSNYPVIALGPKDKMTIPARWGVLADGFGLFSASLIVGGGQVFFYGQSGKTVSVPELSPLYRSENNEIRPEVSFFSVYGQNKEEFYEYWAMILAVLGLYYVIFEKILGGFVVWMYLFLLFFEINSKLIKKLEVEG